MGSSPTTGTNIINGEKSQGALALAAISPANRVSLEASLVELARAEGTGHATPERLVELVREYAAARAALPAGTTLLDAAKEFAARPHPRPGPFSWHRLPRTQPIRGLSRPAPSLLQ